MTQADIAAVAVVLASSFLAWKHSAGWRQRLRTFGSNLMKPPAYRVLFLLVVAGVLLICLVPEAALVLPALDAVGLDIVTILVAFELRHYVVSLAQVAGVRRSLAPSVSHCLAALIAPTNPNLWAYGCMWLLIGFRLLMGGMRLPPQAQG